MAEVIKKATREGYGDALVELADKYQNLYVLDADVAASTKTSMFQKKCPERFFDCGIAEANMMGIAAGIASCGNIVFASSFAMFASGRAFDQIRNSIGYPHLNVKIGATHAGVSVGEDGASHQCNEDIALMRTIPGMVIINPGDYIEAKAAVKAAAAYEGPVYLRFGRLSIPVFNDNADYQFEIGKGITLKEGNDLTFVATGILVYEALKAAEILKKEGIHARVINIHTIKPLDKDLILQAAKETGLLITAEEHSIIGGLGSAVAEVVAEENAGRVIRVGMNDQYGCSGKGDELLKYFGMSAENLVTVAKRALDKK